MNGIRTRYLTGLLLLGSLSCSLSYAESPKEEAVVHGPQTLQLGKDLLTVKLPSNYIFVKEEAAKAFMKERGSSPEGLLGLFGSELKDQKWLVICRFEDCGYVNDDDAGKLNPDEILNSYKEGTKEQNESRKEHGLSPIYVGSWTEKPRYNKDKHQVVWAIQVKEEDRADAPVVGVNYNTRILGRRGVLSMNLVTEPDSLEHDKPSVQTLLDSTAFVKGQTYADFQPGKDKSAGYGLAGLVLGGGALAAAAKFGIFGAAWKWILAGVFAMKKFLIIIVAAAGALIAKFFRKKKPPESEP